MELRNTHRFQHALADIEDAMTDVAFYEQLDLPDVTKPEVLGREQNGRAVTIRLRYVFDGHLDPIVNTVLGNQEIAWAQTLVFDTAAHRGTLTIEPSVLADKVHCAADITLAAADDGCTRALAGQFAVRIPLLGGKAEGAIGPGIQRRLDIEANALADWVTKLGG
ncbi:MAG: DUF2505 family protein [Acidimicrobiia bacterium]